MRRARRPRRAADKSNVNQNSRRAGGVTPYIIFSSIQNGISIRRGKFREMGNTFPISLFFFVPFCGMAKTQSLTLINNVSSM